MPPRNRSIVLGRLQPQGWNVKFIAGRLCLDFINTVGARITTARRCIILREKLLNYDSLLAWSLCAGLIPENDARRLLRQAASHPRNASETLTRAITLRDAIYRIFKSVLDYRRPLDKDLEVLDRELTIARAHERLTPSSFRFLWTWINPRNALDRMLWAISKSAAELLASPDLTSVRQCGGDECGWLFLDTSRNRSRQWCAMRDCGNRAKVRRFRQRQHRQTSRGR